MTQIKRVMVFATVFLLVGAGAIFAAGSRESAVPTGPIRLRMSTAFTLTSDQEVGARLFLEMVEERLADRVRIEYVGGPESINPFELAEAVRSGVVDIGGLPGSYFSNMVPETGAMYLSQVSPEEERANGAFELFGEAIRAGAGAHYIGRYNTSYRFNFYSATPIRTMAEFQGVTFRSSPVYRSFLLALGATPITMPHSEVYTGLERGMIQAIGLTDFGVLERGWNDLLRYVIDPSFYGSDQVFIVNAAAWDRLPLDVREVITEIMVEVEFESGIVLQEIIDQERIDLVEAGMQVLTIPNEGEFVEMAYESAWDTVLEQTPDTGALLRGLIAAP